MCGESFGCKSSHYCLDKEFKLVTEEKNTDFWMDLIDWEFELITNKNKKDE